MATDTSTLGHDSVTAPVENSLRPARRFQFGVFQVDVSNGEVRKQGSKIKLQEKPFQLLVLLLEHAGRITTREELRQGLWSADTFVDFDANLKTTLNKLRQVLGDSAENPIYIETVPRQGYRFLPPVVSLECEPSLTRNALTGDGSTGDAQPLAISKSADVPINSSGTSPGPRTAGWQAISAVILALVLVVAAGIYALRTKSAPVVKPMQQRVLLLVLPFDNLSGDPTQEYFSDGLTDEMITLLGRQYPNGLSVIARTSAMRYRATQKPLAQVARELGGVDYVLEGSVRRSGNHVAINAQLFRTRDQASLWAETYESGVADVLTIQNNVAGQIARALVLEVALERGRHPRSVPNPKIYDAYLMGLYEANQRSEPSLRKSVEYFKTAIQGDASYAPPYAGLANSYLLLAGWLLMPPAEAYPKAKAAALRALELDETLAEAHTTLAEEEHEYEWKWADAEREFRRAIKLDPNSAIAHKSYAEFLMHGARSAEATGEMERARDLDPLSLIVNTLVGFTYSNARQYNRAIEEYEKVIQLDPQFAPAHYFLGGALTNVGRYDEAIAHLQKAKDLTHGASLMSVGLARGYALAGRRDQAEHSLRELQLRGMHNYVSPYGLAQVYAALGDKSGALDMLDRAVNEHAFEVLFLRVDRSFDSLHENPRFEELLKRVGFPQ
jgi:TolB-like protein/DNA-binding winged helix-turn-helix (wHTH) protein/lipopolysaccharide biosynthesis regulator YciM